MFTPLTFNKNQNINIDRFSNADFVVDNDPKDQGIGLPDSEYWTPGS